MTMHKALHLRDDVDWVKKKKTMKNLASIEHCIDTRIQSLKEYKKKKKKTKKDLL